MKIVSVMTTSSRGGAEFAAVEMLNALQDAGHETVLLSDMPGIGRETPVTVRPIAIGPKLSVRSWPGILARWPLLVRRLRAALEREAPYDVLLVHYKKEQLLARHVPAALRPRLAWCEWGIVPYQMQRGLPRRMYLAAAAEADVIMAVSEGTRRNLIEVGIPAERVFLVNNVMRTEELGYTEDGRARVRRELGIPDDAYVVGCVSRFHPKKRNDVLVDAMQRLNGTAHLVLAGSGETEADLRAQAAPMGQRAHFVDTPGRDVADVMSAFDVSVFCPSPTEGQPRAVILGMLAARPCVATGAEGVADMISPELGAIVSPENDPDALAAVLSRYESDPELRARHGEAARDFALRTYDPAVVAAQIERLLAGESAELQLQAR